MIHYFPEEFIIEEPHSFTDPFRYTPHPTVMKAAECIIRSIDADPSLATELKEGKMIGVLVVRSIKEGLGYVAAFSGNVGGHSMIKGFVPPIYDLTNPDGEFKRKEAEITAINLQIDNLTKSRKYVELQAELSRAEQDKKQKIEQMCTTMDISRKKRNEQRALCDDNSILDKLIKESQFEKAELRRLKLACESKISEIKSELDGITKKISALKKTRAHMSERLQDWIFRQYIVHNQIGEEASIADIFSTHGMVPPGGTGECAAPKLLEYAYRNNLKPLAMGEFWYGKSPETAVRTHGHFYPSCTSKCGPLLGFMLKGLDRCSETSNALRQSPVILFQDEDIIVVEKPSGMPSVPGLDGRQSLQEWLHMCHPVHRLDMDTSGVMLFAKTEQAAVHIRRQFEEHSIHKTYMAQVTSFNGDISSVHGTIDLPLSPDYDERPRQKVDFLQGKEAHTSYEITRTYGDGTADLLLYPTTGRTHQLRVHCAHTSGLCSPIIGDRLYGSSSVQSSFDTRLHLHALSITFRHPRTEELLTFTSDTLSYI